MSDPDQSIDENPPIEKISVTPAGDQTGKDTTAELGLSYDNLQGQWVKVASTNASTYCNPGESKSDSAQTGTLYNSGGNYKLRVDWSQQASNQLPSPCTTTQLPRSQTFVARAVETLFAKTAAAKISDDGCNFVGSSATDLDFSAFGDSVSSSMSDSNGDTDHTGGSPNGSSYGPGDGQVDDGDSLSFPKGTTGSVTINTGSASCSAGSTSDFDFSAGSYISVYEYHLQ